MSRLLRIGALVMLLGAVYGQRAVFADECGGASCLECQEIAMNNSCALVQCEPNEGDVGCLFQC